MPCAGPPGIEFGARQRCLSSPLPLLKTVGCKRIALQEKSVIPTAHMGTNKPAADLTAPTGLPGVGSYTETLRLRRHLWTVQAAIAPIASFVLPRPLFQTAGWPPISKLLCWRKSHYSDTKNGEAGQ